MNVSEIILTVFTAISCTWAVASTVYRPKQIDLKPIYDKLDKITIELSKIREGYVKETDCQRLHGIIEQRIENLVRKKQN